MRKVLLLIALLFLPLFGYLFWHTSTTPDTLSDLKTTYPTLGEKITENLSALPTLPIQEEEERFTISDAKPDGIEIQYANQTEPELQGETPKQTIVFPKDAKQPIEVKLDTERVIPITHLGEENYTLDTLTKTETDTPFLARLFQRDESPREYLRYAGERKTLLYAYEKDQATGAKRLKHWTFYDEGTGFEEEQYQFENVKIKLNERGEAEVFYYGDKQIQNEAAAKQVEPSLLERAQRTLEKDLGNDILANQTPDFVIPKPYYLDSRGEQHDLEWKWDEATKTLSVSFSPESYPVALDPTLQFTAPGVSNAGSVITGEATGNSFGSSLTIGDFNTDGKTDLAVGAYGYSLDTGRVYIFYSDGSLSTTAASADVIITGPGGGTAFGGLLHSGDFNADGRTDLVIADVANFINSVYIFHNDGSLPTTAASADIVIVGDASTAFGSAFASGDFNNDGRTDLAVGAYGYSSLTGRAYIFYNDGSIPTTEITADVTITGETTSNYFGASLTAGDFNTDGKTDLAVGAYSYSSDTGRVYLFYNDGSIPTTAGTADVTITGETTSNYFGASLTAGDFNTDGRTDLAVGAYGYSSGTGRVYLFYNDGSIPTTAGTADVTITGETTSNYFGISLIAGDWNADGRTDLAVGAYGYSAAAGRVYLFYNDGSLPTTAATADVTITGQSYSNLFGFSLTSGDFNTDGRTDLAVGAYGYSSNNTGRTYLFYSQNGQVNTNFSTSGEATGNSFGRSLTAGDFNADGKTDLAVGASGYSSNTGRVYIFYNDGSIPTTAASADVTITGETTNNYFGFFLTADDFNTDGKTDLAVGAYGYSTNTGRTYLFYNDGSIPTTAGTADVTITGETTSNYFGISLTAGDWNADGRTDLAVGAYGYSSLAGRTYLFYNDGSLPTTAATADVTITGGATSNYFGFSLTSGDFNTDGRTDLAVGAYGYSTSTGRAYLFYNDGSIPTTTASADVTITGGATSNYFGFSLTSGDFNTDGRTDLAVGAYGYSSGTGRAYLFYNDGSIPTTAATADVIITGETINNQFGYTLTSGDWNSDGRTDLTVGAVGYSSSTGRAYLFYNDGSIPTTAATADVTITGETTNNFFGISLVSGDWNSDGRTDLIVGAHGYSSYTGQIYLYETRENFAWELQQQPQPGSGIPRISTNGTGQEMKITGEAGSSFGVFMTTGDLNNDGKGDLIVGANGYSSSTGRVYVFYTDGSLSGTATSADVVISGVSSSNFFGTAVATGDLNRDGKIDLIVGARTSAGAVYIFYNDGSFAGNASLADVTIAGEVDSLFGSALVTGDFDADGDIDLAAGGSYYSANYTGRVYLFYNDGSLPTTAATADVIITGASAGLSFGANLAAGDLNADGKTDLVVGTHSGANVYIFYNGSITTELASGADVNIVGSGYFGEAVVVGDFNTDGRIDLAVADTEASSSAAGKVRLFYNDGSIPTTAGTADVTISEASNLQLFGYALVAGDFNADGRTDLAVGARGYSTNTGRAFIFYNDGSYPSAPSSADVTLTGGEATNNYFGSALVAADFNADGRTDLAVGATGYSSNAGRVYMYTFSNDPIITGEATTNNFGTALAAGDLNSDGKTDLVVGAYGYSSSTGRVYIFYNDGTIPSAAASADVIITGTTASDWFGFDMAADDVNADGRTDLVVGSAVSKVYIFYNDGSYTSAAGTADVIISGAGSGVGYRSIAIGDVNTDGKKDIVTTAFGYGTAGRAYVYYADGTNNFGSATCTGSAPTSCTSTNADIIIDGSGTKRLDAVAIGDANTDGRDDIVLGGTNSSDGVVYVLYNDGVSFGTVSCTTACTTDNADVAITGETSSNMGASLALGDVNSDGRLDIVVGANGYSSNNGRAYVFYNDGSYPAAASSADVILSGSGGTNTYFGYSVGTADMNLDGKIDIIVGAYGHSGGAGKVFTFYNDGAYPSLDSSADTSVSASSGSDYFGIALTKGDFNNDGKTDLVVGSYGYSGGGATGRVYVFTSEAAASSVQPATTSLKGTGKLKGSAKLK